MLLKSRHRNSSSSRELKVFPQQKQTMDWCCGASAQHFVSPLTHFIFHSERSFTVECFLHVHKERCCLPTSDRADETNRIAGMVTAETSIVLAQRCRTRGWRSLSSYFDVEWFKELKTVSRVVNLMKLGYEDSAVGGRRTNDSSRFWWSFLLKFMMISTP